MKDIICGILAWFWLAALFALFALYNIGKLIMLAFKHALKWLANY